MWVIVLVTLIEIGLKHLLKSSQQVSSSDSLIRLETRRPQCS